MADARMAHAACPMGCRVAAVLLLAAALGATLLWPPRPVLVWNASASAPIGLYAIRYPAGAETGDIVLAHMPPAWRQLAGERRYIPVNVPLVKRVAARESDRVCALGHRIWVNGRGVAERRRRDGLGRLLPWWTGCVILGSGELFLLMESSTSFDGRYFGPTGRRDIIGRARLLCAG